MQQPMMRFERDEWGDWVAYLACGHRQHVRHNPPWINRAWVMTVEGRAEKLGVCLACKDCDTLQDMKSNQDVD